MNDFDYEEFQAFIRSLYSQIDQVSVEIANDTMNVLQDMDNLESKVTTPDFKTADELIESLKG